jgi:hypothetical protein
MKALLLLFGCWVNTRDPSVIPNIFGNSPNFRVDLSEAAVLRMHLPTNTA